MGDDEEFLTVDEVASLLKLNPQTVRNTIDRGDLPSVRFGRRVRIRRSALDEYIETNALRSKVTEARTSFDEAARAVALLLRRGSVPEAVGPLRNLSAAALALAEEIDA